MLALLASAPTAAAEPVRLEVLTFNVWHGLQGDGGTFKLPGEDPERKRRRFALQIDAIKELGPDVLLLQEVNKSPREARRYAEALGYDMIYKVTSCGFHLPPIKIPSNINDGLAILARPELGLHRVGSKRLSGNAVCSASFGFQTRESRFVLLGGIEKEGVRILLATTHLSSPPTLSPDFEIRLEELVSAGELTADQRDEILAALERKRRRNRDETRGLLGEIAAGTAGSEGAPPYSAAILGGDFNVEPDSESVAEVLAASFRSVSSAVLPTWDPVRNHENQQIAKKGKPALPTFGIAAVSDLLAERQDEPRQIDHLFVSEGLVPVSAELALDEERDGLHLSDHFALFAVVELRR